jgi:hypothetical protein
MRFAGPGRKNVTTSLRGGDLVRVRSAEEIIGTLDEGQTLDGLPFMPEMLKYCGQCFRVYKSAHKTCDTVSKTGIRGMKQAVHLDGLRCDGSDHGGCQAACLLFWKEAWLERVTDDQGGAPPQESAVLARARRTLLPSTRAVAVHPSDAQERFRCQATDCYGQRRQ